MCVRWGGGALVGKKKKVSFWNFNWTFHSNSIFFGTYTVNVSTFTQIFALVNKLYGFEKYILYFNWKFSRLIGTFYHFINVVIVIILLEFQKYL